MSIEKRIKIARASGWFVHQEGSVWYVSHFAEPNFKNAAFRAEPLVPNYFTDLNAIHEAAMAMPASFRKSMRFHLYEICGQMLAHEATAEQRSEAFLRTCESRTAPAARQLEVELERLRKLNLML